MKSVFKPETSYGNKFFRTTYAIVARRLKIDPVAEGALLHKRIQNLFWGNDFVKLENKKEREKRQELADRLVDRYGKRSRKFYRIFQLYCYSRGQLRGLTSLQSFILGEEAKQERVDKNIKKLFEEDKK